MNVTEPPCLLQRRMFPGGMDETTAPQHWAEPGHPELLGRAFGKPSHPTAYLYQENLPEGQEEVKNSLDLNCRGEVLRTLTKLQTNLKRCGPIVRTNAHTHSKIRHKAGHMKRCTCSQESDGGSRKARRLMHLMSGALKIHSSQSACRGTVECHSKFPGHCRILQMFKEQVAIWSSGEQIPTSSR